MRLAIFGADVLGAITIESSVEGPVLGISSERVVVAARFRSRSDHGRQCQMASGDTTVGSTPGSLIFQPRIKGLDPGIRGDLGSQKALSVPKALIEVTNHGERPNDPRA